MSFKYIFSRLIVITFFVSCSSSSEQLPKEEVIEDPISATLVFPADNTECNEGTILSSTQSKVVFRWNTSEHTDSYEVVIKNKETKASSNYESSTNSKEITIERGVSYEWHVNSKSTDTEVTATSEVFQFFNAAPGLVNHAPFSAKAITPENGAVITTTTGKIMLQWETSDIDDDIKEYEVFFGTNKDLLTSLTIVTTTTLEVDISSETTYFWKVKTQDESQNTSISDLFNFNVQ